MVLGLFFGWACGWGLYRCSLWGCCWVVLESIRGICSLAKEVIYWQVRWFLQLPSIWLFWSFSSGPTRTPRTHLRADCFIRLMFSYFMLGVRPVVSVMRRGRFSLLFRAEVALVDLQFYLINLSRAILPVRFPFRRTWWFCLLWWRWGRGGGRTARFWCCRCRACRRWSKDNWMLSSYLLRRLRW